MSGFIASFKYFDWISSLDDFAKPQSRPTSIIVMSWRPVRPPKMSYFGSQSVRWAQMGPDGLLTTLLLIEIDEYIYWTEKPSHVQLSHVQQSDARREQSWDVRGYDQQNALRVKCRCRLVHSKTICSWILQDSIIGILLTIVTDPGGFKRTHYGALYRHSPIVIYLANNPVFSLLINSS